MKALSLLLAIGNSGRHYKELICEHSGVKVVVDCLVQSKNETLQEEARILLLNLGRGNPRFQVHVAEMVLSLLGTNNTGAQRTGAQCTRTFMQTLPPGFDYVSSAIPMLKSADLQVQYEAMELLKNLLKYTYLHEVCLHRTPAPPCGPPASTRLRSMSKILSAKAHPHPTPMAGSGPEPDWCSGA